MLLLQSSSKLIMTDSGGMQKEAFWLGIPCVTLRRDTEWTETIESGWNILAGPDRQQILNAVEWFSTIQLNPATIVEDGKASERISDILCQTEGPSAEMADDSAPQVISV
jgi:UDP-N-acetylglucosamine 2-epimerase